MKEDAGVLEKDKKEAETKAAFYNSATVSRKQHTPEDIRLPLPGMLG